MITVEKVIAELKTYNAQVDTQLVAKASEFASRAHEGQTRKSGEPYLIHLLEVAHILTEMRMDTSSVVAAILHDTVEDTSVTIEDIKREFGQEVAVIVDGVTKLSKLQFSNKEVRQAETYRKMILAMSEDIRVILVKLADRLHNMRTLQYMKETKQMSIAQETLDIYAPIAGRMGIQWIKEDLEDLSLKYLKPEVHNQIQLRISRLAEKNEIYLKRVKDILHKQIHPVIPQAKFSGRIKKAYSVYRKMIRQQITIEEVHDLLAFRILVPNVENCYEVLGSIHALWHPIQGRFKDYIAMPKDNNYQSLHTTVVCLEGERVEFQIRTFEMHEIAEMGIAAHWKYKEDGGIDTKDEAKFRWLRQLVEWQKDLNDSIEFVDTMKLDLFSDEIYIFTPGGDVKRFSHGATPVDFAYAVHSDVGNHCSGAKVNGRIVPLNHKLESGDAVEIITNKNQLPNKDWLNFVVTSKAKSHVRQFIREQQRHKSLALGKNIFEQECRKRQLNINKTLKLPELTHYLSDKKIVNLDDYYSSLAYGKITPEDFFENYLKTENAEKAQAGNNIIQKLMNKVGPKSKNLILVDQYDDILVTFAKCCHPIKGDSIVGFITRGRGVTVHRTVCNRVLATEAERRVDVDWNQGVDQTRTAKIIATTEDKKGVLADMTKVISEKSVNISKLLVKTTRDNMAYIYMDVSVKDVNELLRVIKALENVKGVVQVERE